MTLATTFDVIIIGAGAAGLMCAQHAGQKGLSVCVIDHANKAGKKILMSGGGRCNFTNMYTSAENFISANPHFCKSALARYTQWDFIELVNRHKVAYHEKKLGQLFCDNSSRDILDMLLAECATGKVDIRLNTSVSAVSSVHGNFTVTTKKTKLECGKLVIATGGLSIPKMGASGFGYKLAEQFGHQIKATRAGLVPFTFSGARQEQFASLSGLSIPNSAINCGGQSFQEAILFTHRGLSGPAALQASSYWQEGQEIAITLIPKAKEWLHQIASHNREIELKTALNEKLPKRLAQSLCDSDFTSKKLKQYDQQELATISHNLENWLTKPSGTEGYRTAEVTLGGVDTDQLSSKTLESKLMKNLYFIGEVTDVTGHLGGHNFQWAWSSAIAAAESF